MQRRQPLETLRVLSVMENFGFGNLPTDLSMFRCHPLLVRSMSTLMSVLKWYQMRCPLQGSQQKLAAVGIPPAVKTKIAVCSDHQKFPHISISINFTLVYLVYSADTCYAHEQLLFRKLIQHNPQQWNRLILQFYR